MSHISHAEIRLSSEKVVVWTGSRVEE
jgi:hypothetical protein